MSDATTAPAVVRLKPRRAKPFLLGHPWVFSGAIDRVEGSPAKGDVVAVSDDRGRFVGRGFFNADSQIAVRLFSRDAEEAVDDSFWRRRIEAAVALRRETLALDERTDAYRVAYSDSDGLPGLVVDRYADYLVVRFLSAGMAVRREIVLDALTDMLSPRGIYERPDAEAAEREGIHAARGAARGEAPEDVVEIHSDGMMSLVDIAGGQKTGFFLDQRENRLAAARYMRGRSVLDCFCYTGAFGVAACRVGGAAEVVGLDRSAPAVELARRNFALNEIAAARAEVAQVSAELREIKKTDRKFGAVILDPPKFARSRRGAARALRAYHDVNLLAMQLLRPDGLLVTCSCSGHVSTEDFTQTLNAAAVEAGVALQVLERRGQAPDHPVLASCPETAYLKCFICRVHNV